jgi:hypothetical protein
MPLSPPVTYLLRYVLPKLVGPPTIILALREVLIANGYKHLVPSLAQSAGGVALLSFASLVSYITGKVWLGHFRNSIEARRVGANLVPEVKGKLPGNLDVLWRMATEWEHDYIGQPIFELTEEYGKTFNLRILWEDMVSFLKAFLRYQYIKTNITRDLTY